jgi:predicted short-subunit dehydrogenase-like oxidoreductase (DUF2520 family)
VNESPRRCVVVGTGRAGGAFSRALAAANWVVTSIPARPIAAQTANKEELTEQVTLAELVLIAVSDAAIGTVAAALPASSAVYAHVSGASGLDVLAPHRRVGSVHPLMSLPDAATGARRLLDHCTFAIEGDPMLREVVESLGGHAVEIAPPQRATYHAAATIAANHLTALCAQVERLAEDVGVPVAAYWSMMSNTLENVAANGAASALTGPAARADWATIRSHLAALPSDDDRQLYLACCAAAARLAGHEMPADIDGP